MTAGAMEKLSCVILDVILLTPANDRLDRRFMVTTFDFLAELARGLPRDSCLRKDSLIFRGDTLNTSGRQPPHKISRAAFNSLPNLFNPNLNLSHCHHLIHFIPGLHQRSRLQLSYAY